VLPGARTISCDVDEDGDMNKIAGGDGTNPKSDNCLQNSTGEIGSS